MRLVKIIKNEYYHIYLRGNNKQLIYHDDIDRARFLFLILYLQSPSVSIPQIGRAITPFIKSSAFDKFNVEESIVSEIIKTRCVDLVNFALMPNHFHLTVLNKKEDGISQYMQKVLTAYTKYYNTRYGKTGHLFGGPYQYRYIKDEDQLAFVSAYIHRNPRELKKWYGKEHKYQWSSFQDYIKENRWGELLQDDVIMQKFKKKKDYKTFVSRSGAKAHLDNDTIIDIG